MNQLKKTSQKLSDAWFRLARRFDRPFRHLKSWLAMWTRIVLNMLILAPDRYLTVLGATLASGYVFSKLLYDANGLEPHQEAWLLGAAFVVSMFLTYFLCRRDADLYSRIVTENMRTDYSMRFLSRTALRIIDAVNRVDSRLPDEDRDTNLKELAISCWRWRPGRFRNSRPDIHKILERHQIAFNIVESTKIRLAQRFGLSPRVFCEQFFKFTPSIYQDRLTKVALNNSYLDRNDQKKEESLSNEDEANPEEYTFKISMQSNRVRDWTKAVRAHLLRLKSTDLKMSQVQALFLAESTSGSVQRLAYILQKERCSHEDLVLLFDLLGAYRGRLLFRRLLAATIAQAANDFTQNANDESAQGEILARLNARLAIITDPKREQFKTIELAIAYATTPGAKQMAHQKDPDQLQGWWQDVSKYIQDRRSQLLQNFRDDIRDKVSHTARTYLVVSSYSRAVRTALRKSLPASSNIRIFVLVEQDEGDSFGARLIHHVTKTEGWSDEQKTTAGDDTEQQIPELISGNLELLNSLVREGDKGFYLLGAAGIADPNHVYSTTSPKILESISEVFSTKARSNVECFALAGLYKLDWQVFHRFLLAEASPEETRFADEIRSTVQAAKINDTALVHDRDSLTGGLYQLNVNKIYYDAEPDQDHLVAAFNADAAHDPYAHSSHG